MKTIMGSSLKVFPCKYGGGLWCPKEVALNRPNEIRVLGHNKLVGICYSLRNRAICSVSVASAQSSVEIQEEEMLPAVVQKEEMQIMDTDQTKSIHVVFKLQKECGFGEHFLMVGDDPIFGLWDPSNAVPLNWSEGHVWTVELDLPVGKSIKYKFILKGISKPITWQPGPDRVIQLWETEKTLTVYEDWENPELQKIVEELIVEQHEDPLISSEFLTLPDNLTQPREDDMPEVNNELSSTNGYMNPVEKPLNETLTGMVADNITGEEEKQEQELKTSTIISAEKDAVTELKIYGDGSTPVNGSNGSDATLVFKEEVPVLVPGLITSPTEQAEEAIIKEVHGNSLPDMDFGCDQVNELNVMLENEGINTAFGSEEAKEFNILQNNEVINTTVGSDEARELVVSELKQELVSASRHTERTENKPMISNRQELDEKNNIEEPQLVEGNEEDSGKERPENHTILKSDLQWGQRTLQKLLENLGF